MARERVIVVSPDILVRDLHQLIGYDGALVGLAGSEPASFSIRRGGLGATLVLRDAARTAHPPVDSPPRRLYV